MVGELHAALLQAAVTTGTATVCWYLYLRYRRRDIFWWSVAWSLYVLRIGAIIAFLSTRAQVWLFAHQILTGYTALALLWAALTFSKATLWRRWYGVALLFPLAWSYIATFELESFMLAATPAVLFLSFATLWTGWIFVQQWRTNGLRGAAVLGVVLIVWGLHHLDYPLLRAMGSWNPWGYYFDILFVLAMGIGLVVLVLEELERRTAELERLSARMVRQHEDERRRVSLELHDQTAQVWAAVKMQLGLIRESAPSALVARVDRALDLVDTGIRSIRSVTTNLRPPLLDDLGLVAALRALVRSFSEESALQITFDAPPAMPAVSAEAALALYRALQEALSNVVRHSGATSVAVRLVVDSEHLKLMVVDNGRGVPAAVAHGPVAAVGLTGMRERIVGLKGDVELQSLDVGGASLTVRLPVNDGT